MRHSYFDPRLAEGQTHSLFHMVSDVDVQTMKDRERGRSGEDGDEPKVLHLRFH